MVISKSPGGSSFPYYHKGGEIHALKYGSFHSDVIRLKDVMSKEKEFIIGKGRPLRIWIDFYETDKTDEVIESVLNNIVNIKKYVIKLAIVGCSIGSKRKLNKSIRRSDYEFGFPIEYFVDPEDAKDWLVSEG